MYKIIIIYFFLLVNYIFFKKKIIKKERFTNKNLLLKFKSKFLFVNLSFLLDDFFFKKKLIYNFKNIFIRKIKSNNIIKRVIVA